MQRQERLGLASGSPIEMHDSSVLPNKRHTYREEKVLSLVGALKVVVIGYRFLYRC